MDFIDFTDILRPSPSLLHTETSLECEYILAGRKQQLNRSTAIDIGETHTRESSFCLSIPQDMMLNLNVIFL